jgi:hypothetical protein
MLAFTVSGFRVSSIMKVVFLFNENHKCGLVVWDLGALAWVTEVFEGFDDC